MNDSNPQGREWAVGVCVDKHDDHTRATAWLVGALHDLAEKLLTATAGDIEDVTHEHVRSLY
jgi:hypothetical protein